MTSRKLKPTPPQPRAANLDEVEALFEAHGKEAIAVVRRYDPSAYVRAIAKLIGDD